MTAGSIGDALHADAEAARAEIRAEGIVCPSCGVNMADLPDGHALRIVSQGREDENAPLEAPSAQCDQGPVVRLTDFGRIKALANIQLWDAERKAVDELFFQMTGQLP